MFDKTVSIYTSTTKFIPECVMTQEMCDKAVNRCFFVFYSITNQYKTQEMCDRVGSDNPFLIVYYPDKYITQKMCDEALDNSVATLELVFDRFATSKMIKKLLLLCMQMKIYSILIKVFEVLEHFC